MIYVSLTYYFAEVAQAFRDEERHYQCIDGFTRSNKSTDVELELTANSVNYFTT